MSQLTRSNLVVFYLMRFRSDSTGAIISIFSTISCCSLSLSLSQRVLFWMIRRLSNHEKQSRYNQLYNQQKTFSRISHHVGGGSIFLAGEVSQCGIPGGFHQLPARTGTRRSRTICPDSEIRRFGRHLPQFPGEERRCLGRHIPQMR